MIQNEISTNKNRLDKKTKHLCVPTKKKINKAPFGCTRWKHMTFNLYYMFYL